MLCAAGRDKDLIYCERVCMCACLKACVCESRRASVYTLCVHIPCVWQGATNNTLQQFTRSLQCGSWSPPPFPPGKCFNEALLLESIRTVWSVKPSQGAGIFFYLDTMMEISTINFIIFIKSISLWAFVWKPKIIFKKIKGTLRSDRFRTASQIHNLISKYPQSSWQGF